MRVRANVEWRAGVSGRVSIESGVSVRVGFESRAGIEQRAGERVLRKIRGQVSALALHSHSDFVP